VTEVPDYLLDRSRSRRVALGLLSDDNGSAGDGGGASGGASGGGTGTAVAAGPSTADLVAAAKAAAKLETDPAPAADPIWVEAAKSRQRIPMWVLPIMFFLPLWAFVYVKLTEPAPEPITAITEGANTFAARNCASCHGGDGGGTANGGGVGRPMFQGEVLLTFPALDESMLQWIKTGTAGAGEGTVYGDPNRPGGAHVAGETGSAMPGFELEEYQLYSLARYVREQISGEELTEEDLTARDVEWEALGGGRDTGGGGGGHG